jgi:hypothetical protein
MPVSFRQTLGWTIHRGVDATLPKTQESFLVPFLLRRDGHPRFMIVWDLAECRAILREGDAWAVLDWLDQHNNS